jgi:hypothetical protein
VDVERSTAPRWTLHRDRIRERTEVVKADEASRRGPHALDVDVVLDPPDERLGECGSTPRDLIDVAAPDHAVAGVKAVPHLSILRMLMSDGSRSLSRRRSASGGR